ncbi:MAG: hypothetical protein LBR68_06210 [Lachnoclostridium sp.]|jgi:hypothetical protein|nr:hypothetical protein [Lachnoclostridium sp.]
MNNMEIIEDLIQKIKEIEQANMDADDNENKEIRGKIVDSILFELGKVVTEK